MQVLRNEIIESQKFRTDFLKWKLVICAVVTAAALGFSGSSRLSNPYILLALLPFACVYCDILCYHITLRIFVIGEYMRSGPIDADNKYREYEIFVGKCSTKGAFSFEDFSLWLSTLFVCFVVFAIGVGMQASASDSAWELLVLSGAAGFAAISIVRKSYVQRRSEISHEGELETARRDAKLRNNCTGSEAVREASSLAEPLSAGNAASP